MTTSLRMVVAWMLGVVATLCVVALAAWRGQLWFREPRAVCAKEMTLAVTPAPAPPAVAAPADTARAAISEYLRAHFDEVDYRNGRTARTGLAYLGAPLVEVRNDRLQRFLPRTRFFKSTLANADYEDPRLEVLVSYRHVNDNGEFQAARDDIRPLLPLKRALVGDKFIAQFCYLAAPTPRDRQEIALGIAELLATITYKGSARVLPHHGMHARAELRHDGHPYQDIEILPRQGRVGIALIPRHP
jgi:hypothetical protein